MYTKPVDGLALDNDQKIVELTAAMTDPEASKGMARFIALLGTDKKLCRVIRTDSEQEFAGITAGLVGLGFSRVELAALRCTAHRRSGPNSTAHLPCRDSPSCRTLPL